MYVGSFVCWLSLSGGSAACEEDQRVFLEKLIFSVLSSGLHVYVNMYVCNSAYSSVNLSEVFSLLIDTQKNT